MFRSRVARVLLVALIAPLLAVLASAPTAQAASVAYGTSVSSSIHYGGYAGIHPYSGADCDFSSYWMVNTGIDFVKFKVNCSHDWNGGWDGFHYEIRYPGHRSDGSSCSYTASGTFSTPSGPQHGSVASASGTAAGPLGLQTDCSPEQICMSGTRENNNWWDWTYEEECTSITLGSPPGQSEDTSCAGNSVTKAKQVYDAGGWDGGDIGLTATKGSNSHDVVRYAKWEIKIQRSSDSVGVQTWVPYVILAPDDGQDADPSPGTRHAGNPVDHDAITYTWAADPVVIDSGQTVTLNAEAAVSKHWDYYWNGFPPIHNHIVGAGAFMVSAFGTVAAADDYPDADNEYGNPLGMMGVADPGSCKFYWGDQVVPALDHGVPLGSMPAINDGGGDDDNSGSADDPDPTPTTPTTDPDSGCNFSISDPSTWASGGMCAAVGLLGRVLDWLAKIAQLIGQIVTAVGDLAANMISLMTDALRALFLPHPDTWDTSGLQTDLESRAPFSIIGGVAGGLTAVVGGYTASHSCSTLIDMPGAVALGCSSVSDASGFQAGYGLVQVLLYITTAWVIFGMVSRSVGGKE